MSCYFLMIILNSSRKVYPGRVLMGYTVFCSLLCPWFSAAFVTTNVTHQEKKTKLNKTKQKASLASWQFESLFLASLPVFKKTHIYTLVLVFWWRLRAEGKQLARLCTSTSEVLYLLCLFSINREVDYAKLNVSCSFVIKLTDMTVAVIFSSYLCKKANEHFLVHVESFL